MKDLESQLKKDDGLESKVDFLTQHVRELRKENRDLKRKIDKIYEAVEDAAVTQEEKNQLKVEGMNGGPADENIGKIMKKAKTGNGVAVGSVEGILDCSRRHALKIMRKIADSFDNFSFVRGKGNKPSKLKNVSPTKEEDIFN